MSIAAATSPRVRAPSSRKLSTSGGVTRELLHVPCDDGAMLALERLSGSTPPSGIVICAHSSFANRIVLDSPRGKGLASTLADRGLVTCLVDFRGHGASAVPASATSVSYDDLAQKDLPTILAWARETYPDMPIALVGHSLGAQIALATAAMHATSIAAVVSFAGAPWLPSVEGSFLRRLGRRVALALSLLVARFTGRVPGRRLGIGIEDMPVGVARQLAGFARGRGWKSGDGRVDYADRLAHLRAPILSVVSHGDTWWCPPACSKRFLALARSSTVTTRIVGERHEDPSGIDHMGLVTSPSMAPIWREVASWLDRALTRAQP